MQTEIEKETDRSREVKKRSLISIFSRAIVVLKSSLTMKNCRTLFCLFLPSIMSLPLLVFKGIHDCYNAVYLAERGDLELRESEFYHLVGKTERGERKRERKRKRETGSARTR
jgi:hypothetical protein